MSRKLFTLLLLVTVIVSLVSSCGATPTPAPSGEAGATPVGGLPSTAEIKGKNTLAEVAAMYGIPVERIIAEAGLPANVDTKATLQTVVSKYGIEVLNIRQAVDRILAAR